MSDWPMLIQYIIFLAFMTIFYLLIIEGTVFIIKQLKKGNKALEITKNNPFKGGEPKMTKNFNKPNPIIKPLPVDAPPSELQPTPIPEPGIPTPIEPQK